MRDIEEVAAIVVDVAFGLHRDPLGRDCWSRSMKPCLPGCFRSGGLRVERQKPNPL